MSPNESPTIEFGTVSSKFHYEVLGNQYLIVTLSITDETTKYTKPKIAQPRG